MKNGIKLSKLTQLKIKFLIGESKYVTISGDTVTYLDSSSANWPKLACFVGWEPSKTSLSKQLSDQSILKWGYNFQVTNNFQRLRESN